MINLRRLVAFLNIVGLGFVLALGAKLGKRSNEIAVQLTAAKSASEKAAEAANKAQVELATAESELSRVKLGWGYEWVIPPGGQVGQVQKSGINLAVTGVGTNNGLQERRVTENGQERLIPPTVHVFVPDGQQGSRYIGEFRGTAGGLGPTSATLEPTWPVTQQEVASWDFSQGVRLRSQVPPGERLAIEGLTQEIQRTLLLARSTNSNIQNQKSLLDGAKSDLAARKGELTGDPSKPAIADRPELTVGLVQALEDLEEERNATMLAVDELRRQIYSAENERERRVQELAGAATQLPKPESQVSQSNQ